MGLPHGTGGAMVAIIHYKRLWLENKLDGARKKAAALAGLRLCGQ